MTEFLNNYPDPQKMQYCPDCGWSGTNDETKHSLWIEMCAPEIFAMKVQFNKGDGMDYDCPRCHYPLVKVRFDKNTIIR